MSLISTNAHGGDEPMASINVTSLVDVMFCLLIMFMVATPLMSKDELDIDVPRAKGAEISEEDFLFSVISVDATGQVYLGVLPLSKDPKVMATELSANAKLKEDGMAFIQGDANVAYEKIVDVLAALKEAGIQKVGFMTDPRIGRGQTP